MPAPPMKNLSSYLQENNASQRNNSLISSLTSGLWSIMTLGMVSSTNPDTKNETNNKDENKNQPLQTFLPPLPNDSSTSSGAYAYETQIDCSSRLLAWQSCHILLVLVNNCTNESLYNPYRLALFHFTDTQGS
jgi:hypothetical protein